VPTYHVAGLEHAGLSMPMNSESVRPREFRYLVFAVCTRIPEPDKNMMHWLHAAFQALSVQLYRQGSRR
jgi:hypothetical protein